MRGLGDFQRAQMRDTDPRVGDFFNHVRHAVDVLEQIMLRPHRPAPVKSKKVATNEKEAPPVPVAPLDQKLSYTIKEVRKLVGISNATLYRAIGNSELRAVKLGHKTLIMAKDLQSWLNNLPTIR